MIFRYIKPWAYSYSKTIELIRNYTSTAASTKNILSDYFGLVISQADYIVEKYKLQNCQIDNLLDTLKFFHDNGFSKDEVLACPSLLKLHPLVLDQRYMLLKESGFLQVSTKNILSCRKLWNKNVITLKIGGYLPKDLNVAERYKQYLNPAPENLDVSDLTDGQVLSEIHGTLLKRYLLWRLDAQVDEIERLFRIYKVIRNKSIQYLCENIIIAEELGVDKKRLLKYGYLLHNYPKYTRTTLEQFSNIAGGDLRKAMKAYPKLITVNPKNYIKVYGVLKEHNIPDETIRKTMNIFHHSPETVKLRLQEVESIPELRALLSNPRVLKLIVHHNRAKSRLTFLQELRLKCANLMFLGSSPTEFDLRIKEGRDINPYQELLSFLKSLLQTSELDLEFLRKHPFHQNVPFVQMEETYYYLRSLKYSNVSILKALHILLYPIEHVKEALRNIKSDVSENINKLSAVQQLNMILYFMEREHHFTGNGVWKKDKESS